MTTAEINETVMKTFKKGNGMNSCFFKKINKAAKKFI